MEQAISDVDIDATPRGFVRCKVIQLSVNSYAWLARKGGNLVVSFKFWIIKSFFLEVSKDKY